MQINISFIEPKRDPLGRFCSIRNIIKTQVNIGFPGPNQSIATLDTNLRLISFVFVAVVLL